jgi:alpha-tubulin suppressor-like RCC1 family protein
MSQIMEKFDVLNKLNDEFKQRVKILYVFENYEYMKYIQNYFFKGYNVLIVTKDDKTFAFGKNSGNQLGFGHNKVVNEIQIVEELCDQQIIGFANGFCHCIARNSSGKVYCWGRNDWGFLGIGSQDESFHKPKLNQYLNNEFVIDISCGAVHSLVLTNCGEVYAWGWNFYGQIGNGCNRHQLKPIKVKCFNNERVVMISCGYCYSMALIKCGHVYSWGRNEFGQLGIGNTVDSNEPKFVAVIDENKCNVFIEKIICGIYHSLLLSSDGNIYAFGRNEYGELGNQKEKNDGYIYASIRYMFEVLGIQKELSPLRIKIETKFIDISSRWNEFISIALSKNGIYYNWGKCGEEIIRTPKKTNFESIVEIYAKYLKITHKAILCNNTYSQLGFGHKRVVNEKQIVEELCDQQIIDYSNGVFHCIARNSNGKVYCLGWNYWGFLGIGSQDWGYHKPILNQYLNNEFVIDISCGAIHSLVLTNCGEVYAWGYNENGQIGNGCNRNQLIPIKVKFFNNERVVMISCGRSHSMALTECGHVYSWGYNDCGQLGIGNTENSNEPKFVAVVEENKCNVFIEKISCGSKHSLLLSSDGNIYAFGGNYSGELGNQKEENELSPHRIKLGTKFIDISSHWTKSISIALSQNGIYYNWGKCGEEIIRTPKPTNFESFVEIYAKYFKITNKAIGFEKQNSVNRFNSQPNETYSRYKSDFKELELIGSGSFGTVSKVMHKNSKKNYAIKRIFLNEEESEKAFKELDLMKGLKSRFVVEYFDSWCEKRTSLSRPISLHIQMEFCRQTLNEVIIELSNKMKENDEQYMKTLCFYVFCELFTEIIECVHYLHGRNVIHRDLKPANILITNGINGRFVKLADFGISVNHEFNDQSHTQDSGTLNYMAPEVGNSRKYDMKADIFSLGKIVEELFLFNSEM